MFTYIYIYIHIITIIIIVIIIIINNNNNNIYIYIYYMYVFSIVLQWYTYQVQYTRMLQFFLVHHHMLRRCCFVRLAKTGLPAPGGGVILYTSMGEIEAAVTHEEHRCFYDIVMTMIFHDISWYFMIFDNISWYFMIFHDISWYFMIFPQFHDAVSDVLFFL